MTAHSSHIIVYVYFIADTPTDVWRPKK